MKHSLYLRVGAPTASRPAVGRNGAPPLLAPPSVTQVMGAAPRRTAGDAADSALQQRFRELVREWKEAVLYLSSGTRMVTHPAYQQIIGLGPLAVPLLLEELRREPDHWFWALRAITGANPVAEADQGKLAPMTAAWLRWAQENGY